MSVVTDKLITVATLPASVSVAHGGLCAEDHAIWLNPHVDLTWRDLGRGGTLESAFEISSGSYDNVIAVTSADSQIAPAISCTATDNKFITVHTATKDLVWSRFMFLLVAKPTGTFTNKVVWNSGTDRTAVANDGHFGCIADANGNWVIRFRDSSSVNHDITIPAAIVASGSTHSILVCGDIQGVAAYVDNMDTAYTPTVQHTEGWKLLSGNLFRIGADHTGTVAAGTILPVSFDGFWSRVCPDLGKITLLHDPWTLVRPAPAAADIASNFGMWLYDLRSTSVHVRGVAGLGALGELSADTIAVSYQTATSWDDLRAATPVVLSVDAVTDVRQVLDDEVTLAAGTENFFLFKWSTNGTDFYPFPVPFGRARTKIEHIAPESDEHSDATAARTECGLGLLQSADEQVYADLAALDMLTRDPLPDVRLAGGDNVLLNGLSVEGNHYDWNDDMWSTCATYAANKAALRSWIPSMEARGNHEMSDRRDAHCSEAGTVVDTAAWKQAQLCLMTWMPLGDSAKSIHPAPEIDSDFFGMTAWQNSVYVIPGGVAGTVLAADCDETGLSPVTIVGTTLLVDDVVDAVVEHDGGCLYRKGMTVTDVTVNDVTMSGGTGEDFSTATGAGPFNVRVHLVADYARQLMVANGMQCAAYTKIDDVLITVLDGRLESDTTGQVVGVSVSEQGVDTYQWGSQKEWALNLAAGNVLGKTFFLAHTPVLGADAPTYYSRSSGANWQSANSDSVDMTTRSIPLNVDWIGGHDHSFLIGTFYGSHQVRIGQSKEGNSYSFGGSTYGDTRIWGADAVGTGVEFSSRHGGWLSITVGSPSTYVFRQTSTVFWTEVAEYLRLPLFGNGWWAFGPDEYAVASNTIAPNEPPNIVSFAMGAAAWAALSAPWPSTIQQDTDDLLTTEWTDFDPDYPTSIPTSATAETAAMLAAYPRTVFTDYLQDGSIHGQKSNVMGIRGQRRP